MLIYVFVNIMIITLGFIFELINSKDRLNPDRKNLSNYFFIIPSFALLFTVSSFRGDFTTDYNNYISLFELYNRFGFLEVFQTDLYQEEGYIALSRLIGAFTSNELYLFIVVSFVTLCGFYSQFNKYSTYIWLSVLMFVTVGAYYTSFNTMRQILAVSIVFAGSKFLYERKLLKYCLVVILAALFHKSALVMIVFYFMLNLKLRFRNLIIIILASVVSALYLDTLLTFIQKLFYSSYTSGLYGMTGLSFTNTILPIAVLMFSLFHYRKIDLNNTVHKIWINAVIFYALFSILGLKVQMIQRISEFFAPYLLLLIPLYFSKMKNNELKVIYMLGLISLLILYNYVVLSGTGYDPYYFTWKAR